MSEYDDFIFEEDDFSTRQQSVPGLGEYLGIKVVDVTPSRCVLVMPLSPKAYQPFNILHGGISCYLAESAASIGGFNLTQPEGIVVGISINMNHLRSVSEGTLRATATLAKRGKTVQFWDVEIIDSTERVISRGSVTLAVLPPGAR